MVTFEMLIYASSSSAKVGDPCSSRPHVCVADTEKKHCNE